MTMQQAWLQIYRNFDDDALAALASAGLVRRAIKDVDAGKVAWEAPPGSREGALRVDGQRVAIGAGGPAKAACDCPAPDICKHILAATIWLRAGVPAGDGDDGADGGVGGVGGGGGGGGGVGGGGGGGGFGGGGAPKVDIMAELLALEPAALFKGAGVVATRKAAALFADAGAGAANVTTQGGALLIELPQLDFTCRYISGGGFAGMVSEAAAASRTALHLVAIAAVRRQQGHDFSWPGEAIVVTAPEDDALTEAERQYLERLRQLLLEVCRGGWAHVSDVIPAQLRALAMSARIESFPRLAGLLRGLAGITELLVKRDLSADERQAIRLAARIYALSLALARGSGETLRELRGRARRRFDDSQALELLPLGAHWWEHRGGAKGLTISFWDPASASVMQAALARRDGADIRFNRGDAWSMQSLWSGAGTAQRLCAGALALDNVRLSDDSRISLASETQARVLPRWSASDDRWSAAGYDDWRALADAIKLSAGLRGEALDCVLLKPAARDTPRLDEARQIFHWRLRDTHGAPLSLRLSCDATRRDRIAHIEAWHSAGVPIKAVLARLDRDFDGGALEPLALIIEERGMLRAVSLDYEGPGRGAAPSLLQRLSRMLQSKPAPATDAATSAHQNWIDTLLVILENKGMTGRLHLIGEDKESLTAIHRFLLATGLDVVAGAVERYLAAPDTAKALMLVHLCQTCAELDTGFIQA
jgi:hypothetical protein